MKVYWLSDKKRFPWLDSVSFNFENFWEIINDCNCLSDLNTENIFDCFIIEEKIFLLEKD